MEIEPKIMSQVKSILGEFGNKHLLVTLVIGIQIQ